MTEKTRTTENGAIELEESALDEVAGGSELFPKAWKIATLDGKSNDVATAELTIVHEAIVRR